MNKTRSLLALALAGCTLAAAGAGGHDEGHHANMHGAAREQTDWGIAGNAKAARRTIRVTMSDDMRFTPAIIEVGHGETVRFEVRNAGKTLHEMVLGTKEELAEHAKAMARFPGMEHEAPWMLHVKPGSTGTMVWTFNRTGEFEYACLIAGHFQAGMVGRIRVVEPSGHRH
jgi:uncharacterized cupredoxin-like copper-binding protein